MEENLYVCMQSIVKTGTLLTFCTLYSLAALILSPNGSPGVHTSMVLLLITSSMHVNAC